MAIVQAMRRAIASLILLSALATAPSARAGAAQCWYENGALVVPAALGDIAGDFILDVSAPRSALHNTIAQGAGIEGDAFEADLRIAGERLKSFTMAVEDLDARSVGFDTTINGVIGADVLQRFVVEIDFDPCRVAFHRRAPDRRAGAGRLRVSRAAGVPVVEATAFDGVRARRGLFAIDTASAGVRLDPEETSFSRPLPLGVDPTLRHRPPARLAALSLAGRVFPRTPAGLLETPAPGLTGAIGDAVWSHYRMRLNLKAGWLELEPVR
ncbi:MAG TPA: hypothetical protein VFE03_06385 [Caulobacteraceae bacterium]|nr:hypothetical protein [Caulobacteraceae bacterium]